MGGRTRHLVLVAGAGRSGTSMIAGALSLLGVHVPLPHLKTNESNPRGFFESQWPVRFHRRLLARAFVEMADGRPTADRRVRRAVGQPQRDRLATWLGTVMGESDQVLVKDPRSIWVPWLWEETAAELGVTTGFVTMLRHPAEVLGSRSTYYTGTRDNMGDFRFAVMNLCGWVNANLTVERGTRGKPRVFLRYSSLVEDWRPGLRQVKERLGLDLDYDFDHGAAARARRVHRPGTAAAHRRVAGPRSAGGARHDRRGGVVGVLRDRRRGRLRRAGASSGSTTSSAATPRST